MALKTKIRVAQLNMGTLDDDVADALSFKEGSNSYLQFQTDNDEPRVAIHQNLFLTGSKRLQFNTPDEALYSDGTDIHIAVGSGGDVNLPANIGMTFGNDGEKIEGDGTDLTITANQLNLTVTSDVVLASDKGIVFGDAGEKIEGDGTDLTITGNIINLSPTLDVFLPSDKGVIFGGASEKIEGDGTDLTIAGAIINLNPTTDVVLPNEKGIQFGGASEKIEGDGTDLTVAGAIINLSPTTDVVIPVSKGLVFGDGAEKIESDNTDFTINSGVDINLTCATGDVNIPSGIGLTFGDDGEKIEGDGTDLTIAGAIINLSPATDVVLPNDKGVQFGGASEKIEGDGTDLTIEGNSINLTAATDVVLPAQRGLQFGASTEKIEADGSNNLNITAAGTLTLNPTGDLLMGAAGNNKVRILGDLQVDGHSSVIDTTNLVVEDPLIVLGSASGTLGAAGDRGLLFGMAGAYGGSPSIFWDHASISSGIPQGVMRVATAVASGSETSLTALNYLALAISDLDLSNGVSDIKMKDNESAALEFKEAGNLYMHLQTSDNDEAVGFAKKLHLSGNVNFDTVDMDFQARDNRTAAWKLSNGGSSVFSVSTRDADESVVVHSRLHLSGAVITADTADQSVILRDNRPAAWAFKNGATTHLSFQTSDNEERVAIHQPLILSGATIDSVSQNALSWILPNNQAAALTVKNGATSLLSVDTSGANRFIFYKNVEATDNMRVGVGTKNGTDCYLTHDSTDSWLKNETGDLYLSGAGGALLLGDSAVPATWAGKGLKLSSGGAASWTNYETAFGAEQNLLDALTDLKNRSVFKSTGSITTARTSPAPVLLATHWAKSQVVDVSTRDFDPQRVDVFINGQLLVSGTAAAMSSSAVDYTFDLQEAAVHGASVTFAMNIAVDDVLVIKMN